MLAALIIGTIVLAIGILNYASIAIDAENTYLYIYLLAFAFMSCILGAGGIIGRSYPIVSSLLNDKDLNSIKVEIRDVLICSYLLVTGLLIVSFVYQLSR